MRLGERQEQAERPAGPGLFQHLDRRPKVGVVAGGAAVAVLREQHGGGAGDHASGCEGGQGLGGQGRRAIAPFGDAAGEAGRSQGVVLAEPQDIVARLAKVAEQVGFFRAQEVVEAAVAAGVSRQPSEEAASRGPADRELGVTVCEPHALPRQPVEMRRLAHKVAIRRQGVGAQLVGHEEDNVRTSFAHLIPAHGRQGLADVIGRRPGDDEGPV